MRCVVVLAAALLVAGLVTGLLAGCAPGTDGGGPDIPKVGEAKIDVDTHFGRLARRFGWTEETDPVKVEHAIGALFPKRDWTMLSHHLIWHGRRVCHSKKPACGACTVARWCPSYGAGPTDPEVAAALVKTQGPA